MDDDMSHDVRIFKAMKSRGLNYILFLTAIYNILTIFLIISVNMYELSMLLKLMLAVLDIYQLYYIMLNLSLKYSIDKGNICIIGAFGLKKVIIPIESINACKVKKGKIKGTQLYGYNRDYFAFGKSIIEDVGISHMFVTSGETVIYINTDSMNYGISPYESDEMIKYLTDMNFMDKSWHYSENKNVSLYKDKKFLIPFLAAAVIIIVMTLNPFILYLCNKLPSSMPLKFNAGFKPVLLGSGKQFVFRQMVYGVLNMALLFCMYYAAYFYAKYDKKSAYKFMYVPLIISAAFFIMQSRILLLFR